MLTRGGRRGRVLVSSPCSLRSFRAGRHRAAAAAAETAAPSLLRHRPPARLQAAAWSPEPGLFPLGHRGAALCVDARADEDGADEDDD
ncbi:hypothetical protein JOB18_043811 [Solea senegalensis]|uniref:Uncharacterized protein n=1 Tax=Solea senegalensis TaxID=28829 RepID=A0AAV6QZH0_SOLSE|nr:hypothetical protein JOB18_043811 [Solea senegalensis]